MEYLFRIEDLRQYKSIDEAVEKLAIPYGGRWGG
jgi:hypothetical protein